MDDNECFRCGAELLPLEEMSLVTRLEQEEKFRSNYPNWKEITEKDDKVRVCDRCDDEIEVILMLNRESGENGFTDLSRPS